jgi:hypothetical protein
MSTYTAAASVKDPRVDKAVQIWLNSPALTVVQVMHAAQFCPDDAVNRSKQAWIRRRAPTKKETRKQSKPSSVELRSPESAVSSLTEESPTAATNDGKNKRKTPAHPMPKPASRRRTTKVVQQDRVAEKTKKEHEKKAHKRSTELYAAEKKKEGGMSAHERGP